MKCELCSKEFNEDNPRRRLLRKYCGRRCENLARKYLWGDRKSSYIPRGVIKRLGEESTFRIEPRSYFK